MGSRAFYVRSGELRHPQPSPPKLFTFRSIRSPAVS
jgi:hypothetical protein